jgi:hypothetical protein
LDSRLHGLFSRRDSGLSPLPRGRLPASSSDDAPVRRLTESVPRYREEKSMSRAATCKSLCEGSWNR